MSGVLAVLLLAAAPGARGQGLSSLRPKIDANEILHYALSTLEALPSGRTHWKFLSDEDLTLAIGREAGLSPLTLSVYEEKQNTILLNADFLDNVYNEMDAAGVPSSSEIARHMGSELAPALAHDACHAELAASLADLAARPVPDSRAEEAACLYEELLAWKELEASAPGLVARTVTDLDRSRDRIEAALVPPLLGPVAEHYPALSDDGSAVSTPAKGPTLVFRGRETERSLELLERKIRGGGAGLEKWQRDLLRVELLERYSAPLEQLHPPRISEARDLEGRQAAAVRTWFAEKLRSIDEQLRSEDWRRWRASRHPDPALVSASGDAAELSAASKAAIDEARQPPDLLLDGNSFYLRRARALARKLGEDISLTEKETTLLQEAKIRRLLSNADRLSAQGDDGGRRWSYLSLKRAELESREVWDMTPQWIVVREGVVIDQIRKQLSLK